LEETSCILLQACKEGRKALLETEANAVCREYGIPITRFELSKNENESVKYAEKIGYPVVLKIVSPDIIHKSDVGGVIVDLRNADEVKAAHKRIIENVRKHKHAARIVGILVQEMAPPSTEIIIGSTKDPQFGPAIMFGLGGVFVEIMKDVAFRIAPITEEEASEMITEVRAYPLLTGYRNSPPADIAAIIKILLNVSKLVTENQEIKELDLNPVMIYPKGAKTVDARIILE